MFRWESTGIRRRGSRLDASVSYYGLSTLAAASSTTSVVDPTTSCHTLIVGAGPVGLSTAYHLALARNGDGRGICVVERDPTGNASSAVRSAGGIRQQFSLRENVQLSLYGRDFLRQTARQWNVNFVEGGYLFLAATPEGRDVMVKNHAVQHAAGATDVSLLEPNELRRQFPWLHTDDILLGSYGSKGEGWFDPWALMCGFKRDCQAMGVHFIHGEPVTSVCDESTGKVHSVVLRTRSPCASGSSINFHTVMPEVVVNAAGAHCADVLEILASSHRRIQYPLPVKPRKRSIYFFHCPDPPSQVVPLTIDPLTGVYVRSDDAVRGTFLCGVSPSTTTDTDFSAESDTLDHADATLFEEVIWPSLYHRVPAFGNLKVQSSWSGLYEYNCMDQNAIIDFHPELPNVLLLNGFSGHGLQQSPAVGRAAAELIETGRFQTLDLRIFSFNRCMGMAPPVLEAGIV